MSCCKSPILVNNVPALYKCVYLKLRTIYVSVKVNGVTPQGYNINDFLSYFELFKMGVEQYNVGNYKEAEIYISNVKQLFGIDCSQYERSIIEGNEIEQDITGSSHNKDMCYKPEVGVELICDKNDYGKDEDNPHSPYGLETCPTSIRNFKLTLNGVVIKRSYESDERISFNGACFEIINPKSITGNTFNIINITTNTYVAQNIKYCNPVFSLQSFIPVGNKQYSYAIEYKDEHGKVARSAPFVLDIDYLTDPYFSLESIINTDEEEIPTCVKNGDLIKIALISGKWIRKENISKLFIQVQDSQSNIIESREVPECSNLDRMLFFPSIKFHTLSKDNTKIILKIVKKNGHIINQGIRYFNFANCGGQVIPDPEPEPNPEPPINDRLNIVSGSNNVELTKGSVERTEVRFNIDKFNLEVSDVEALNAVGIRVVKSLSSVILTLTENFVDMSFGVKKLTVINSTIASDKLDISISYRDIRPNWVSQGIVFLDTEDKATETGVDKISTTGKYAYEEFKDTNEDSSTHNKYKYVRKPEQDKTSEANWVVKRVVYSRENSANSLNTQSTTPNSSVVEGLDNNQTRNEIYAYTELRDEGEFSPTKNQYKYERKETHDLLRRTDISDISFDNPEINLTTESPTYTVRVNRDFRLDTSTKERLEQAGVTIETGVNTITLTYTPR